MDILATQVYEDDDSFTPTQQLSHSLPHNIKEKHIGSLRIGSITYPIEQGITKIGRHPECDIVLNNQTVSKKHAEIEVNSNETWICDLNSSNKTKLNSSVLRSGRYYELKGGSVVEFGMVRAVYSVLGAMDESLIQETPTISHSRTEKMIIPGTPDTSMNFSSTSEDNVSIIPGTQAEKGDSVFRRPSVPVRSSASNRKSYLPDSSSDDSMNDSRGSSALGKENLGEKGVSTHDMGTENSFESQSDLSDDIHDVETQKICLDSFLAAKQSRDQADIHNMETQHEEDVETQHFVTDIHDVETQHDIDIDDLNTLRKTEVQNALVESDKGASAVEQGQTEEAKLKADVSMEAGKSEIKEEESCSNAIDRPEQAIAAKDENSGNSEQLENGQRDLQDCLELSITTNFDDECSEVERSSSQNLLENFISDDDPANESGSKSVSPLKSSVNNNETTEKSSDEENIFDMATQANPNNENIPEGVTKRVDYTFKASLMEDDSDDDTDQEGVFQRYSRIASQDSSQGTVRSKSQPDSEDSDTDEEGQFAAMAMKEKRTSLSFEVGQNESKETRNDAGSSRDSDDLFEIATQKVNLENSSKEQADVSKDSVDFNMPTKLIEANKLEDIVEKGSADFDTPTQVIEVSKPEDVASKGSVDFDTPTQVIDINQPVNVTEKSSVSFDAPTQMIEANEPEDVVEECSADFDTPTQVIDINQPVNVTEKGSVSFDTPTQLIGANEPEDVVEECSADFDTPTQVIDINQPVNVTEKGSVNFNTPTQLIKANEPEDVVEERSADFGTPTQVIDTNQPVNVAEKGSVNFDTPTQLIEANEPEDVVEEGSADFDTPTQVIDTNQPVNVTEKGSVNFDTPTQLIEANEPEDVEEGSADFDTPTQVIDTNQPVNVTEKGSVNFDTPMQLIEANEPEDVVEEGSADFDTPTQVIEVSKPEDVATKVSVDFDTPTQVMDTNQPVNVTEKSSGSLDTPTELIEDTNKDEDDLMPTQILPIGKISRNVTAAAKGNTTRNEDRDEGETDYNTPTQIIAENVPIYKDSSSNDSERVNPQLVEEFSMEDIDYEMAPTQLLSDIEEKKKAALANKKNKSRGKLIRVNLDDTLERNLNEMFGDVNEDIEDDLPRMSTQVLTSMLESPQNKEEPADVNVDEELPGNSKEKTSPRRTRGKPTAAKLEVSPLIASRKSRRSSLKKAVTNDDSQNDFSNPTTRRKRKLLEDSKEIATIDEDKVDTECEKKSTKNTLNDENNISAASSKSSPKNSPSTRFSRTNKPGELQMPEPVVEIAELPRGNKNVAVELDRGDEVSITSVNIGQYGRAIILDSDEDIMAGLPEVQISGTLSNPASPTSSTSTEFRFTTRSMKPKSGTKKTEPRKKVLPKKSTRKSIARTNAEDNEPPKVGRLRSAAFSYSIASHNKSRVPVTIYENDEDIVNEIKPSNRTSSRKSKETGSLQAKPSPSYTEVRRSPSIQDNGRTRGSSNEYNSSVFQVGKEALITTVAESVRKTAVKASRAVKRSLSSTDVTESSDAKKRKENVTEKASVATKGRKSTRGFAATRSNSANILDYMSRRDSPVLNSDSSQQSVSSSQESYESKQLVIKIRRLSSDTLTPPPLIPMRSAKEDGSVRVNSATSSSSKAENDKSAIVEEKVHLTRGNRSKRAVRKNYEEDDSSEMGEESQEVEMIMNSWVKEENVKQEETNESTKGARGRGTRGRSMNSSSATSTPTKIKHKILFTGITNEYSKLLSKLGSSQVEDPAKCTVLVTDKVRRTVKFLCALAQAVPIVSVSWLVDSEKAGRFTELDNYILKDPAAEAKFGFRLRGSLEKAKKQKLLDGYTIVVTPNVAPPPVQELKSIISSCGGKPLVRPPPSWPQNAVIISREEDMANAKKFLAKASKTVTVQSTEFILTGILRQELDFVKYKLT